MRKVSLGSGLSGSWVFGVECLDGVYYCLKAIIPLSTTSVGPGYWFKVLVPIAIPPTHQSPAKPLAGQEIGVRVECYSHFIYEN